MDQSGLLTKTPPPWSLALDKLCLNLRNFQGHLLQSEKTGVHLPLESGLLMHKRMMNAAVIRDSSFIAAALDSKVPESNKSNGLCNLQRGGLVSF